MIVVTGGAGFIGSRIIKELNNRGFNEIILIDDLSQDKIVNVEDLVYASWVSIEDGLDFISANIEGINLIYHYGACSDTNETDADYIFSNNYEYTRAIIDACTAHNVPVQYASSASVYGESEEFNPEKDNYSPRNLYGFTKLMIDKHVRRFINDDIYRAPIQGMRFFNVISDGEFETHKTGMKSPTAWMSEQAEQQGKITLFEGSDEFKRDFIHIDSVLETVFTLMPPVANGHFTKGIFNIGMGEAFSFQELAEGIFEQKGIAQDIEYIPMPEEMKETYQKYTCADTDNQVVRMKQGAEIYKRELINAAYMLKCEEDKRRSCGSIPAMDDDEVEEFVKNAVNNMKSLHYVPSRR